MGGKPERAPSLEETCPATMLIHAEQLFTKVCFMLRRFCVKTRV
jgi:hypothetical protein